MLVLLAPPAWAPAGQVPQPLPATVPAALLVVLAAQAPPGAWIARDRLAAIFWPEAAPADALHHLRINLHRSRTLLDAWGRRDALVADRTRVRLDLPTDLAEQHAEQQNNDAAAALRHGPPVWLPGWQLTGYELFGQWADEFAQSLHSA